MSSGILLESGNNEVEIFEYMINDQGYGINVLKVRQILVSDENNKVTSVPDTGNGVVGVVLYQGDSIPVLDIGAAIGKKTRQESEDYSKRIMIMCEFNNNINAILVDGVKKIHRITWDDIKSASITSDDTQSTIVGVCHIEGNQVLLLDYEEIFSQSIGSARLDWKVDAEQIFRGKDEIKTREKRKILLADDSRLIRSKLLKVLNDLGYTNIDAFQDGKALLDAFQKNIDDASQKGQKISDVIDMVITDIEMPQMDGLTLCNQIKKVTKDLPVLVISSLINQQMKDNCASVQANSTLSKKEIHKLGDVLTSCLGE